MHQRHLRYAFPFDTLFIHSATVCLSTRLSAFSDRGMLCCAVPPLPRTVRLVPRVPVAHPCSTLSPWPAACASALPRQRQRCIVGRSDEVSDEIDLALAAHELVLIVHER